MAHRGRPCSVCKHEDVEAIDAALIAGEPLAKIVVRHTVSKDSLANHKAKHLGELLQEVKRESEMGEGDTALARLEALYARTNRLLAQVEHNGSAPQVLQAVREARATLESIARITGELNDKPVMTINLAASPEWLQLQALILNALTPFPEARLAVSDAIDVMGEVGP